MIDYREQAARNLAKDLRGDEAEWPSIVDTFPVARMALGMAVMAAKAEVAKWFR